MTHHWSIPGSWSSRSSDVLVQFPVEFDHPYHKKVQSISRGQTKDEEKWISIITMSRFALNKVGDYSKIFRMKSSKVCPPSGTVFWQAFLASITSVNSWRQGRTFRHIISSLDVLIKEYSLGQSVEKGDMIILLLIRSKQSWFYIDCPFVSEGLWNQDNYSHDLIQKLLPWR